MPFDASQTSNSFLGMSDSTPSSYYNAIPATPEFSANAAGGGGGTAEDVEMLLFRNIQACDTSKLLDCLQLRSLLGVGSMGTVYNASLLGQRVVLKVIEHGAGLLKREKERGRLAKMEAVICKLMVHPNIVTTYAFHTGLVPMSKLTITGRGSRPSAGEKMVTLLVQEYCSRGTLRDALVNNELGTRAQGLTFTKIRAKLLAQVAYGLQHAHSVGVVHGDLKAENILLQSLPEDQRFDGDLDVRAKLGDLGIATVFPAEKAEQGSTAMHGTVSHMPPEALSEPNIISTKTDIWSFGMLMWEVWTGELPYAGKAPQKVVQAVLAGELPPWPDNTPPVWRTLAMKCLSSDAAARPTTLQLAKALDEITAVLSKVDNVTANVSSGGAAGPPGDPADADAALVDDLDELLEQALVEGNVDSPPISRPTSRADAVAAVVAKRPAPGPAIPTTAPENDPVAALLWHLLREPQMRECLQVDVSPHRQVLVTKLPFLNAQQLGLVEDASRLRKAGTAPSGAA